MLISKHSSDYFPSSERLVLRMPTKVHELFSRSLGGRINEQLRLLSCEPGPAADFAKDIRDVGSATIRPRDPTFHRDSGCQKANRPQHKSECGKLNPNPFATA